MNTIGIKSLFSVLLLAIVLVHCKDEPAIPPPNIQPTGKGLYVVNEGTFGMGNASLSFINLEDSTSRTDIDLYKSANNLPLGDIFQSMALINNNAWLIVNNSSKIEVIATKDSKSIATIKGLKSPRYALEVGPGKVYVTDLFANAISIIDANTNTKTGGIKCNGWTEELIMAQNKVWVTNFKSHYLYVINPINDEISDSIKLAYGGSSILSDKAGKIWVLCSGDLAKNKTGGLFCINPINLSIEKQILFKSASFNPIKLKQNKANDTLYYINQGIYAMAKTEPEMPSIAKITQPSGSSFYGLTINANNGNLLVADAVDFVSRGNVFVYSNSGILLKSYKVGIVPGEFMWR